MGCRVAGRDDRGDGFLLRGETRADGRAIVDAGLNRSDIREEREGVPLDLNFNVSRIDPDTSCTPLAGALVDI